MTTENNSNTDFMGYTPGGKAYEILPSGTYDYVIHGIVGLGLKEGTFEGKPTAPQAIVKVIFEIPEHKREDGQTELLSVKFPISSGSRSNYYKFCTTLLGQGVTDNEQEMDKLTKASGMKSLLGKTGTLTVVDWKNGQGRSVSNKGFYPLHPKAPVPIPTREPVFFNPFSPDIKVFKENLTGWTRKEIMSALNADSFSEELKQAYKETLAEAEQEKQQEESKTESAPWAGSTEAIQ